MKFIMNSHGKFIQTEWIGQMASQSYLHMCFPPPKEVQEDLQGPELVCTDWNWGLSLPSGGLLLFFMGHLSTVSAKTICFHREEGKGKN